jgi:hypothetical protein
MIILPNGLTPPEIRVLQEYRRVKVETMSLAAIKAIKHPAGGGEAPAVALVDKGWLDADETREQFALTQKARDFLAIEAVPENESGGDDAELPDE